MPNKSQSVFLAGAAAGVAAVLSGLIPTVGECLACLAYIAAGLVAVWHYTDRHQLTMKGGQGLSLGALAGLVATLVQTVLEQLFVLIGLKPTWLEEMRRGFEQSGLDPAQIDQMQELMSSPFAVVGVILIWLVLGAIAGAMGGVIGANIFKSDTGFFEHGREPTVPESE